MTADLWDALEMGFPNEYQQSKPKAMQIPNFVENAYKERDKAIRGQYHRIRRIDTISSTEEVARAIIEALRYKYKSLPLNEVVGVIAEAETHSNRSTEAGI